MSESNPQWLIDVAKRADDELSKLSPISMPSWYRYTVWEPREAKNPQSQYFKRKRIWTGSEWVEPKDLDSDWIEAINDLIIKEILGG